MPEYLAPGVYVEETSFRARSIQGVGTSTTGFVGLTRKGPRDDVPQLVTSFAEFERLYGGLEHLNLGGQARINYLAYAVRGYFNEGGSRLYIAAVFQAGGAGDSRSRANLIGAETDPRHLLIRARYPGSANNGRLLLSEQGLAATDTALDRAVIGSLARSRGAPATPPVIDATAPPAALADGSVLRISVNGAAAIPVTLNGAPAAATGQQALADPMDVPAATALRATVNGLTRLVGIPAGNGQARADVVTAVNGGLAPLATATLDGGDRLVITSAARGRDAEVVVEPLDLLGFTQRTRATGTGVRNLEAISPEDLNELFAAADGGNGLAVQASRTPAASGLRLTGAAGVGAAATLAITGDAPVRQALGFPDNANPVAGQDGAPRRYFVREALGGGGWREYAQNGQRWQRNPNGVDRPPLNPDRDWIITLNLEFRDADGVSISYEGLGLAADHPRALGRVMAAAPPTPSEELANPLVLVTADVNPVELHAALTAGGTAAGDDDLVGRELVLGGGNDGVVPSLAGFEDGLRRLGDVDDIAIVAAPGAAALGDTGAAVRRALVTHAEQSRFRIAVLDPPPNQDIPGIRVTRGQHDSSYAALYYPWIVITNPLARPGNEAIPKEVTLPPSGHVCGIYARNDALRGVWKTPANEVVREALRFEREINHPQQEVLNPIGINCLRFFSGRGNRVYGGRLATSDREVVYVSDRRYLNYLKRSVDISMQWAVFEPNGPQLWSNVRDAVSSFLYTEWRNGALLGGNPDQAFFVRCDRSTMTQADLDNGRLICEIGVAIIKPAEFVIFRIGQKTADARN